MPILHSNKWGKKCDEQKISINSKQCNRGQKETLRKKDKLHYKIRSKNKAKYIFNVYKYKETELSS